MGSEPHQRQDAAAGAPLVAFDFDGTLTERDSFLAFLTWRAGPARFALGLVALVPDALRWLVDRDRGRLKRAVVRRYLRLARRETLQAEAELFASRNWEALMRPDALDAWRGWRDRGARLVIVTASPEPVVAPFARRLGAERLIATRLAYDIEERTTGDLVGANCRGMEKRRRLEQVFGDGVRLEAAYGDSEGDREMLSMAAQPGLRVFTARAGGKR
jgi:phosphatidylglycerophosphatase C